MAVEVRWQEGRRFEAVGGAGVPVMLDGDRNSGPSPMEALLMGLAGCMAVDVVDILHKMRVPFSGLAVRADGERRADPPRRFTAVRLVYRVEGMADAERDQLQRAIDLSREKYCSVLHTLQPDLDLEILIEVG